MPIVDEALPLSQAASAKPPTQSGISPKTTVSGRQGIMPMLPPFIIESAVAAASCIGASQDDIIPSHEGGAAIDRREYFVASIFKVG